MASKTWGFSLEDGSHTVRLVHGLISGKREIYLDENLVEKSNKLLDFGSTHTFRIGLHDAVLRINTTSGLMPEYYLTIDKRPITSSNIRMVPTLLGRLPVSDPSADDQQSTPPVWAWSFALACFALVVVGGCIGGGIGGAGGMLCLTLSRNESQDTLVRVALCLFVTIVSLGLYLAFGTAFSVAFNRAIRGG